MDDFLASYSTPKRQRISSESVHRMEIPAAIEGPSRRKTPTYLDVNDNHAFSFFRELPLDSPTTRPCRLKQEFQSDQYHLHPNTQAPFHQRNPNENFNPDVGVGDYDVGNNLYRELTHLTETASENIDLNFHAVPLNFHPANDSQSKGFCVGPLLRAETYPGRKLSSFSGGSWLEHEVTRTTHELSSNPSLNSLSSSLDPFPIEDFGPSTYFTPEVPLHYSQSQNESTIKCVEMAIENPNAKPSLDVDLKQLYNVPMLSLNVTNNFREAQIIINMVRCEAMKRRLYSDDRDIWSDETSRAFEEAIRAIPPLGRAKILALTPEGRKPFGRNELIADYIYRRTGITRDRKQVSSHIQVIKNSKKMEPLRERVAELLGPPVVSQKSSFDECSASWFGAYLNEDVLTVYPCTPEFPFVSQTLQHQPSPQNDEEYAEFLEKVSRVRNSRLLV